MACCEDVKAILNQILTTLADIDGRVKALESRLATVEALTLAHDNRLARLERVLAPILQFENTSNPPEGWLLVELATVQDIRDAATLGVQKSLRQGGATWRENWLASLGDALGKYALGIILSAYKDVPLEPTIFAALANTEQHRPALLAPAITFGEPLDVSPLIIDAIANLSGGANENTGGIDKFIEGQNITGHWLANTVVIREFAFLEKVLQEVVDYVFHWVAAAQEEKDPVWKDFRVDNFGDADTPSIFTSEELAEIELGAIVKKETTDGG